MTSSGTRLGLLPSALLFLLGVASGWYLFGRDDQRARPDGQGVAASATADERSASRISAGVDGARLASLEASLARIEEQLHSFDAMPDTRTPLSVPSEETQPESAQLELAVQRLQESLDLLLERTLERPERLQRLRDEHPEADSGALGDLLSLWSTDEEAARKSVLLLSDEAVLKRFGSPGLMYGEASNMHWIYGQDYDAERDAYRLQIVLRFDNGSVNALWVEE